jgi:hypothetical protein
VGGPYASPPELGDRSGEGGGEAALHREPGEGPSRVAARLDRDQPLGEGRQHGARFARRGEEPRDDPVERRDLGAEQDAALRVAQAAGGACGGERGRGEDERGHRREDRREG